MDESLVNMHAHQTLHKVVILAHDSSVSITPEERPCTYIKFFPLPNSQVEKAVAALQKHHTVTSKKGKAKLIEENPLVSLIIAPKKIPDHSGTKPHRM